MTFRQIIQSEIYVLWVFIECLPYAYVLQFKALQGIYNQGEAIKIYVYSQIEK